VGGGVRAVGTGEEAAEHAHGRAHHGQLSGAGCGRPCAGGHREGRPKVLRKSRSSNLRRDAMRGCKRQ
jgi:hypothetical protein